MVASLGQVQGLILHAAAGSAPSQVYYFHNDHLGTPQVITDESGQVVWKADCDPFGEANVVVQLIENNFRFPGQWFDEETGLHQNWYRDYASQFGRYIQPDPIGMRALITLTPGERHLYVYCVNFPLGRLDPFGLDDYDLIQEFCKWQMEHSGLIPRPGGSPPFPLDPKTVHHLLDMTAKGAGAAAGASLFMGDQRGFGIFSAIGLGAKALDIALYSEEPFIDALKEDIKLVVPKPWDLFVDAVEPLKQLAEEKPAPPDPCNK